MRTLALLLLLAAPVAGCGAWNSSGTPEYSTTAQQNYDRGIAEMKKENWDQAIKLFQYVRSKFSFSKWATLAELGIADANFGREKFPEAVDGYRNFIKNHPTHPMVQNGYAEFKIGQAYYKEIPSEWFLVPPAYEKDQGPVRDALRELGDFITEYSDSKYLPEARKMAQDCVKRLAEHELYVANFYLGRNKPVATIGRLEGLLRGEFLPKVITSEASSRATVDTLLATLEPEVLLLLGRTYLKMDKPDEARNTFQKLIALHPNDFRAGKAKLYLDYIARRYGGAPSSQTKSTPSPGT